LILSSPPGGAVDLVARTLAKKISESLQQQVIVDNRPGGGQIIGTDIAAKAEPDGYTLLVISITHTINPGLGLRLPYDSERDFSPISMLATSPLVLVVHPSTRVKTTGELIALAKSKPGQLNFAGSNASGGHLAMELLLDMTGTKMMHVPYNGATPALIDLIAGRVQVMMTSPLAAGPHIMSGKLSVIGVSSRARQGSMPRVPAIAETVPGYEASLWYGLLAPKGLAGRLISRLNAVTQRALASEDVRSFFESRGVMPEGSTPEEFSGFIRTEIDKWRKVIQSAGIKRG